MPAYPLPDANPACRCRGNRLLQFWCPFGHVTTCHYPYDCETAGCGHLATYDHDIAAADHASLAAVHRIAAGTLPPYVLDERGNVAVDPDQVGADHE
jgi:hypothetical protein